MNDIIIRQEERDATFTPPNTVPENALQRGVPVPCMVLGLFQCADDAYFIIELQNGQVAYANPTHIRFAPVTDRVRFLGAPNA